MKLALLLLEDKTKYIFDFNLKQTMLYFGLSLVCVVTLKLILVGTISSYLLIFSLSVLSLIIFFIIELYGIIILEAIMSYMPYS